MTSPARVLELARKVVRADSQAREMADYAQHPDFAALREAAQAARDFLRHMGVPAT